jgi:hypothetical protein
LGARGRNCDYPDVNVIVLGGRERDCGYPHGNVIVLGGRGRDCGYPDGNVIVSGVGEGRGWGVEGLGLVIYKMILQYVNNMHLN